MRFLKFLIVVTSLLLFAGCASDDDATAPIVDFKDGLTNITLGQGSTKFTIKALIISEVSVLSQIRILHIDEYGVEEQIGGVITAFDGPTYELEVEVAVGPGTQFFDVEAINLDAAMTVGRIKVTVAGPIPLSTVVEFTLGYPSSNENPKVQYGITYDLNYLERPEARFVGRFVVITESQFKAINHRQLMISSYAEGDKVDRFDAKLDANFNKIHFIVLDGDTYRLIEMMSLISSGSGVNISSAAKFNEQH